MLEHTQGWFQKVHKHLDSELTKLSQMGISSEDSLILLLEEVSSCLSGFTQSGVKGWIVKSRSLAYIL
jgi:hypothetical protein